MSKRFHLLLFALLGFAFDLSAQKFTLSGYMKDASNGEELIGSTIYFEELKTGTTTNVYGFYSITLAPGNYNVTFNYVGYEKVVRQIKLDKDTRLDIELTPSASQLGTVEITGEKEDQNVTSTEMSVVKIDIQDAKTLPVLFGEADILKTIQLMPGVMNGGEGSTGLYVRGGGPDQNLILLDEAPVYNASHLLGFFSVFNSDAVKDIELYKGGIPAEYGGRISSVLDVKMNEGNSKKFSATGGVGLIASRLTVEGPLIKDKSSFIISGRRTYADMFLKAARDTNLQDSRLFFYDLNLKANVHLGEKDRLFLSGYFGEDVFGFSDIFGFRWGNTTGTLRWNHLFGNKLFLNTTAVFSNYQYELDVALGDAEIKLLSGLQNYNLKADFSYFPNVRNDIKFGANTLVHRFFPPSFESNLEGSESIKIPERYALESAAYFSNDYTLSEKISIRYGIRYSIFNAMGPGEHYVLDDKRESVVDTVNYKTGEIYKTYHGPEPRLAITYLLNGKSSIKASYNRTRQYIHLLSNTAASSPTDLWIPSGAYVAPQIGDQIALGYFRNFKENVYEGSIEVYGKDMQNQIDYKNGANIVFNPTIETELLFGTGRAYGVELLVQKKRGKFTGWIGYTLSRSERLIDGINNGEPFPVRYDRTHDISVVGSYKIAKRIIFSATWVYATGNAVTFPVGKYEYNGQVINYYTERNGYRMPPYHRGDVSLTIEGKKGKKFQSGWNFSIYNVYARKNPYSISFRQSESDPLKTEAVQLSLFTIIPSITWNFKF